MSSRIRLKCSNKDCDFSIGLWKSHPIFKAGTPENLMKTPVSEEGRKYVLGYADEEGCLACGSLSTVNKKKKKCPVCLSKNLLRIGSVCPKCGVGKVVEGGSKIFM